MNLVEFKQAIDLKHHMISKPFTYPNEKYAEPLFQTEYLRSPCCPLLIKESKCTGCRKREVQLRSQHNAKREASSQPAKPNAPLSLTSPDRLQATVIQQR